MSKEDLPIDVKKRVEYEFNLAWKEIRNYIKSYGLKKIKRIIGDKSLYENSPGPAPSIQEIENLIEDNHLLKELLDPSTEEIVLVLIRNHIVGLIQRKRRYDFSKLEQKIKDEKRQGRIMSAIPFKKFRNILFGPKYTLDKVIKKYNRGFYRVISKILLNRGIKSENLRRKIISELIKVFELEQVFCYRKDKISYQPKGGLLKAENIPQEVALPIIEGRTPEYICDYFELIEGYPPVCNSPESYCPKLHNRLNKKIK